MTARTVRVFAVRICAVTAILAVLASSVVGYSPMRIGDHAEDGMFIRVDNPITEKAVLDIEGRVKDAIQRHNRSISVIVFEFNPFDKPAGTSGIFPCMHLKDYISRLSLGQPSVKTVAFVHDEVTDHTVLPILACREIVMSTKGKFGNVLRGSEPLPEIGKQAYAEVVKSWPEPKQLLTKLLDASKNLSMFDFAAAQKAGLCKAPLMEDRFAVKDLYELPAHSLHEDVLGDRTPVVWRIEVHGALDPGKLNSLDRRIKAAIRAKANVIILHLDCEGGETIDAHGMAEKLRTLTDEGGVLPVKTIAYIPSNVSLGAATFLAVGCSEIVMSPDARLGGFEYLKGTEPDELTIKQKMLVELAKSQGYPAKVFQDMLDPNEFLSIDAKAAKKLGIVRHSDVTSPEQVYIRYGFDSSKAQVSRDDWLDSVAAFLRSPVVNVLLIMVGVAGLILELKIPGFGVPGIVAAICFVLFFWSHAFAGQSSWEFTLLAVLLFLLGLALLAIELFVLPGFGITGISGIILLVTSLVLVLLEQMPTTSQDWISVTRALTTVGIGLVAGMVAAITIAQFLPSIPYAGRLVLKPPLEDENTPETELTQDGLHASALLGAVGVTRTTLHPAGTAQFGERYLDVIAEGDFVDAGARVQVIEIEGNRIVVKALT